MDNRKLAVKVGNLYYNGFVFPTVEEVEHWNFTLKLIEASQFSSQELADSYAKIIGGKVVSIEIREVK